MEGMESTASVTADNVSGSEVESAEGSGQVEGQAGKGPSANATGKAKPSAKPQGKAQVTDDDHEEISIGAQKVRVPKSAAQTIKHLERAFHAKSQEAAQLKKAQDEAENLSRSDRKGFLKRYGIDPVEFAEMTLAEQLEHMSMSPEQKKLMETEAKLAEYTKKEKEEADRVAKEAADKEEAKAQDSLGQEIADAWKESGLPNDLFYVKQIAALMRDSASAYRAGTYPKVLTAKDAASIVKQRFENFNTGNLRKLDAEKLYNLLGPEKFAELRKWDLDRVTNKAAPTLNSNTRPATLAASSEQKNKKSQVNEREWRKFWEE
jgi:hypothetical protein